MPSGSRPRPSRPRAVDIAAAILVVGGLVGLSQLVAGTYVITGSLPAKAPIVGVAFVAYAVSVALGVIVRYGRGWLFALNFSALAGLLYLPAAGRPLILTLVLAHGLAAALLATNRPWFDAMAARRQGA